MTSVLLAPSQALSAPPETVRTGLSTAATHEPVTLVCLPPAGGSPTMVRPWRPHRPPWFTLQPISVRRLVFECDRVDLVGLAEAIADGLPDRRHVVFGHSLGGLLAVEALHRRAVTGRRLPDQVIVAGSRPPHTGNAAHFAPLLDRDDDGLLSGLVDIGAIAPELLNSPARPLLLPGLRADLRMIVGYQPNRWWETEPLPVPLHAWHAPGDNVAPPQLGRQWADYTRDEFRLRVFDGDHFFPTTRPEALMQALVETVTRPSV